MEKIFLGKSGILIRKIFFSTKRFKFFVLCSISTFFQYFQYLMMQQNKLNSNLSSPTVSHDIRRRRAWQEIIFHIFQCVGGKNRVQWMVLWENWKEKIFRTWTQLEEGISEISELKKREFFKNFQQRAEIEKKILKKFRD